MEQSKNLFEIASRNKYLFGITRESGTKDGSICGRVTTNDLWDLDLPQLNEIALSLQNKIASETKTSFIDDSPQINQETQNKFDIVLYIINVKKSEKAQKELQNARRAELSERAESIQRALQERKKADLLALPADELERELAKIQAEL